MAFTTWGQFLTHDIDLTNAGTSEPLYISLNTEDSLFNENNTNINFFRSKYMQ